MNTDDTGGYHRDGWDVPQDLYAIRGVYDPMQFAVRLQPDLQAALATVTRGSYQGGAVEGDVVLAQATYLHEMIHWWQHIGTTFGFVLSLSFPVQSHINDRHLRKLLDSVGPVKSLSSTLSLSVKP